MLLRIASTACSVAVLRWRILGAYPDLTREDIHEALQFAAEAVRERAIPLTPS
jgi:hypothetical protein